MQGPSPGTGALCRSGAQHMEDGGGVVKAVVTGLPGKLAPLLSIPGVGPLWWLGEDRPLITGQLSLLHPALLPTAAR